LDRYRCTAAAPWTPDKGQFAEHEDVEVRDKACGCCERHTCRVCGQTWTVEVPD
jgi:hypothetical protein